METKIVNKRAESYDVYIGRGSIFGNPYEIGRDGTRVEVIARYKTWFDFCIKDGTFRDAVLSLKGKTLGCFCKPSACHGDIIVEWLNNH